MLSSRTIHRRSSFIRSVGRGGLQKPRRLSRVLSFLLAGALTTLSLQAAEAPVLVSPGASGDGGGTLTACPTFSWVPAEGSKSQELLVFRLVEGRVQNGILTEAEPVLQVPLPAGASSWTATAGHCLRPDLSYAWTVGAEGRHGETVWSDAVRFDVVPPPFKEQIKEAVEQILARGERKALPAAETVHVRPPGGKAGPADRLEPRAAAAGGGATMMGPGVLGNTSALPLDLVVAGERALRLQWGTSPETGNIRPSVVGGSDVNQAVDGAFGAAIGGGGGVPEDLGESAFPGTEYPNLVSDHFGTVGGGWDNRAGLWNGDPSGERFATVGGGEGNDATAEGSTIGGGRESLVDGQFATVGGGSHNRASGAYSVVPGGSGNHAGGLHSFAAGRLAHASHNGTFVWSDVSDTNDFQSTGPNQFLVRAVNGVGLGTPSPDAPLDVAGGNNWDLSNTEGDVRIGNDTYRLEIGVALGGGGAGTANIHASGGAARINLGRNGNHVLQIDGTGVYPGSSGTIPLGKSGSLWKEVWSTNGTIQTSDARLKRDVTDLEHGLEEILALRPVAFRWNDAADQERHLGFLAQEAETVVPEVVERGGDEGSHLGMSYMELVPVLVRALQEQQGQLAVQQQRILALEREIETWRGEEER